MRIDPGGKIGAATIASTAWRPTPLRAASA
jgi:hypothetical protein